MIPKDNTQLFGTDDYEDINDIYTEWTYGKQPVHRRSEKVNRLTYECCREKDVYGDLIKRRKVNRHRY